MKNLGQLAAAVLLAGIAVVFVFWIKDAIIMAATTRYVSQGGGTFVGGSACSGQSTISVATFNGTTNSPGDLDVLCGTITSALTPSGAGSNGNPVTIKFDSGASMQFAAVPSTGAIVINANYYLIDGGGGNCGWPSRANSTCSVGFIESTANGSGLANQVASVGISLSSGLTGIEIKGLLIGPLYQHTSTSDTTVDQTQTNCVRGFSQTSISVHNNTMHDVGWCVDIGGAAGAATTGTVTQNEIYNMDHGVVGGAPLNITISSNHFHDMANWDTLPAPGPYHHDGIHAFTDDGATTTITEYNNLFDGDMGNTVTAWVYNEASSGTLTATQFNEVAYVTAGRNSCCGVLGIYSDGGPNSNSAQYNNAVIGPQNTGTITGPAFLIGGGGAAHITGAKSENNLVAVGCCQHAMALDTGATVSTIATNAYEDVFTDYGASFTNFGYHGSDINSVVTWATDSGETGAVFNTLTNLKVSNSTAVPSNGSPLCGAGTNLTSLGITALNSDASGNARPSSGAWDIGPYNCASSGSPIVSFSPTSLSYGNQQVGTTSGSMSTTLQNTGSATLNITSIGVSGTNPGDWSESTTCGSTLAASATCTISATFTPAAVGGRAANFSMVDNASGSPHTVPLSGTGTSPPVGGNTQAGPGAKFGPGVQIH